MAAMVPASFIPRRMLSVLFAFAVLFVLMAFPNSRHVRGLVEYCKPGELCAAARPCNDRVVVLGDIHGDDDGLRHALKMFGLTDESDEWIGGRSVLVQVGDMVDRGSQSLAVMDRLMRLQEAAAASGGAVEVLLGNHEAMNLQGIHHYVASEELNQTGGELAWRSHFSDAGRYGAWLRDLPVVVREGRSLAVHAGFTNSVLDLLEGSRAPVADLNQAFAEALRTCIQKGSTCTRAQRELLYDGPTWTRAMIFAARSEDCALVERATKIFDVDRIFVGHTIQSSARPTSLCSGRLVAVDVGLSSSINGVISGVELCSEPGNQFLQAVSWAAKATEFMPLEFQMAEDKVEPLSVEDRVEPPAGSTVL